MKIIFFMYGFVGGGAERVTSIIANGLADRGYEILIMSYNIPQSYTISPKIKFKYFRDGERLKRRIITIQDMRRVILEEKPNVVIGVLPYYSFWLRIATVGLNVKVIGWDHDSFATAKNNISRNYFIKYWIYPFLTKVFVLTNADKNDAYYKRNLIVMPNPLIFKTSENTNEKEKLLIGVGNVSTWYIKGFDLLIKVWSKIHNEYKDWKLLIIGRGDSSYLNTLKERLNCKNIEIISFSNNIIDIYKRATIFVLSSRSEGFPMVLLEAMSQGCACVACDNSGRTKEVLGDNAGLIYQTGNIEDMSEKIEYYIKNPEQCRIMGLNAIKRSEIFDTNTILNKWEHILKSL